MIIENKDGFVQEFGELLHFYSNTGVDYAEYDEDAQNVTLVTADEEHIIDVSDRDIVDIATAMIEAIKEAKVR